MVNTIGFNRVFLTLFGSIALLGGAVGLVSDLEFAIGGREVQAVTVGSDGSGEYERAVVEYVVDRQRFRLTTIRGHGFYTAGDSELLRYMPDSPSLAREEIYVWFDLGWCVIGCLCLGLARWMSQFVPAKRRKPTPLESRAR